MVDLNQNRWTQTSVVRRHSIGSHVTSRRSRSFPTTSHCQSPAISALFADVTLATADVTVYVMQRQHDNIKPESRQKCAEFLSANSFR